MQAALESNLVVGLDYHETLAYKEGGSMVPNTKGLTDIETDRLITDDFEVEAPWKVFYWMPGSMFKSNLEAWEHYLYTCKFSHVIFYRIEDFIRANPFAVIIEEHVNQRDQYIKSHILPYQVIPEQLKGLKTAAETQKVEVSISSAVSATIADAFRRQLAQQEIDPYLSPYFPGMLRIEPNGQVFTKLMEDKSLARYAECTYRTYIKVDDRNDLNRASSRLNGNYSLNPLPVEQIHDLPEIVIPPEADRFNPDRLIVPGGMPEIAKIARGELTLGSFNHVTETSNRLN